MSPIAGPERPLSQLEQEAQATFLIRGTGRGRGRKVNRVNSSLCAFERCVGKGASIARHAARYNVIQSHTETLTCYFAHIELLLL